MKRASRVFQCMLVAGTIHVMGACSPAPGGEEEEPLGHVALEVQGACCKTCVKGKACGDTCIDRSYTCHVAAGCACNADPCQGVVCTASNPCHAAGVCDPATGACGNPPKPEGAPCDDGDPATSSDVCVSGSCAGSPASPATRRAMTWRVLGQSSDLVLVGSDALTNAASGDTSIDTFLPVLCLGQLGAPLPEGLSTDSLHGWAGGEVRATPSIPGSVLESRAVADAMCEEQFGAGFRMAELHDGAGTGGWWATGTLTANQRFWVAIDDAPADPWSSPGAVPPLPAMPRFLASESPAPDRYIVLFPDDLPESDVAARAQSLVAAYGGQVEDTYTSALKGFTLLGSDAQAQAMSADTSVDSVEQDSEVQVESTQQSPGWGLDRIDQRHLPLDGQYSYVVSPAPVNVYVLDTGFRLTHSQFGGRARQDADFIHFLGQGHDCDGHGTAVASVVGGVDVGVAKNVNLISVRVAGCKGVAYNPLVSIVHSTLVAGMDWVRRNHVKPAVANISYGFSPGFWRRWLRWKTPLDRAVAKAVAAGITVVVAAGNEHKDVERSSPAREPSAITVAATDWSDTRVSFSNYGSKVDLFAPGQDVLTAGIATDTEILIQSGTSFSAPYVAGAAALYLGLHPSATPAEVANALTTGATPGVVQDPKGSPNRLLFTRNPYWTPWLDRDDPTATGDWETLTDFVSLGQACANPIDIECQTLSGIDWTQSGQVYACHASSGGVCKNADQSGGAVCLDYRVRFLCP